MATRATCVGLYDHLGPLQIRLDMDALAAELVRANYGVHRILSALIRARQRDQLRAPEDNRAPEDDRLMREIERLLDEGEF